MAQVNGSSQISELQSKYDAQKAALESEYNRKKGKLEERIEAERDKMSSSVTNHSTSSRRSSIYHFIMVLDESGSMSGNWSVIRETY